MSSKRGRKRNDSLPPNRARDVQRAFRARRAAHLQALEERVTSLEEENDCLRQALNLPPANRPALGKGPTGKDKPRSCESPSLEKTLLKSSDSSDSPSSTRTSSLSPLNTAVAHNENPWDQAIVMNDNSDVPSSSNSVPYPLPSMSIPPPSKSVPYFPSSSRSLSGYQDYSQQSNRAISNSYPAPSFSHQREDHRAQYAYSPAPYDGSNAPPTASLNQHLHRNSPLPFTQRRSLAEPQTPYAYLSNPMPLRLPSPPHLQGNIGGHHSQLPALRQIYANGRSQMS